MQVFNGLSITRNYITNSSSTSVGGSKTMKKDDEFPQFNKLVSKLMLHQQESKSVTQF